MIFGILLCMMNVIKLLDCCFLYNIMGHFDMGIVNGELTNASTFHHVAFVYAFINVKFLLSV